MPEKIKKILIGACAVVLVVVVVAWMILNPGPEHIEDTNGADNYSLQTITEADVAANKMGSRGGLAKSDSNWYITGFGASSSTQYSCRKFTGVSLLYAATVFKGSDISLYLADYYIYGGNFAFYVVFDGEVVGELRPNEFGTCEFMIENLDKTGTLEYIIAGESADFRFVAPFEWQ